MNRTVIAIYFFIQFLWQSSLCWTQQHDSLASVSLLALGDVNLGRTVGQEILKGNLDYPFEKFENVLTRADVVFANLECPVTDQHGETQSPKSNVVFCAPPDAAKTLRRAGITIVSTANNHAFDYGLKGLQETIKFLAQDSIPSVGTAADSGIGFLPVILAHKGITFGVLAYTQFVNIHGNWEGRIALFDSGKVCDEIRALKPKVDFILVSYHGGDEYTEKPGASAERDMEVLAAAGANVVFGHHSHVPQGIKIIRNCLVFHSLGNAVFNQPQRFWTQRAFAPLMEFNKRNGQKEISSIELIPIHPGFQIQADLNKFEARKVIERIQSLSTVTITHTERGYLVEPVNVH